jgi:hypothetical protein
MASIRVKGIVARNAANTGVAEYISAREGAQSFERYTGANHPVKRIAILPKS